MAKLEQHEIRLSSVEGFIERYLDLLTFFGKAEDAYNAAERQHFGIYGRRKYNDYSTFKSVLSRWSKGK